MNKVTEFLIAADCYSCVDLKLYVESILVDKYLAGGNAAELLILADSHSCALLKEAATKTFVADPEAAKQADGWSNVKESNGLLTELLDAATSSKKESKGDDVDQLSVSALRMELDEANLELDWSREILISRLKSHRQGTQP